MLFDKARGTQDLQPGDQLKVLDLLSLSERDPTAWNHARPVSRPVCRRVEYLGMDYGSFLAACHRDPFLEAWLP